ncbi:MAG TPA: hypothetical protein VIS07_06620 [Candidatus Binatia bacterium]
MTQGSPRHAQRDVPREHGPRDAAPPRASRARVVGEALLAALLYALATPWVLRPWFLARDAFPHAPGPYGTMADADLYLNVWILAWIAHAVLTNPAALYDGNIFHPAPNTIAGSENMLAHLPVTAPVLALTGNALTMLKALVFESFVLSGVGMFLFVRHHTRSFAAALLAGAAYTFTSFRAATIPQPQYLGIQYLPLALLFVDLWLERRRAVMLVGLAASIALQALACVYVGFFTLIAVPVYAAVRLLGMRERRAGAVAGLAVAFAGGLLALVPVALPYLRARAEGMIPAHDPAMIRAFSLPPWDYFSSRFLERAGLVPLALVLGDLLVRLASRLTGVARRLTAPERALWVVAATAAVLATGPVLEIGGLSIPMPYLALYELVPGFSSVRVPLRFVILIAMALAALAGFAFARWTRSVSPAPRTGLALALVLGCVVAAAPRPTPVVPARLGDAAPEVYRWLAAQPGSGSVLEVPSNASADDVVGNLRNGRYMVASTIHWRPLVNGYTAYPPTSAPLLAAGIREMPRPDAIDLLSRVSDLEWVIVHRNEMTREEAQPWRERELPGLELVRSFGDVDVYRVTRASGPSLADEVLARSRKPAADTLQGTPTTPLAPACRRARLVSVAAPPQMMPVPLPRRVPVTIANDSDCRWPALGVRGEGLVALTYRWTSPSGAQQPPGPPSRLLHDVEPRSTLDTTLLVTPPAGELGTWQLDVQLVQDGLDAPLASVTVPVVLREPRQREQTRRDGVK